MDQTWEMLHLQFHLISPLEKILADWSTYSYEPTTKKKWDPVVILFGHCAFLKVRRGGLCTITYFSARMALSQGWKGWEFAPLHRGQPLWVPWEPVLGLFSFKNWANLFGTLSLGVEVKVLDYTSSDFLSVWLWLIHHLYLCVLFWGEPLCLVQDGEIVYCEPLWVLHLGLEMESSGYTVSNILPVEPRCCLSVCVAVLALTGGGVFGK